jgi:glycosyltransferase involved in cell wall biosynthesis
MPKQPAAGHTPKGPAAPVPPTPATDRAERITPSLADLDQPPRHRGYVDGYADQALYGWCLCAADPAAATRLDIYLGAVRVGTASTDVPRPDIAAKLGLDLKAGFRFAFRDAEGGALGEALAALAEARAEPGRLGQLVAVKVQDTGAALPLSPHFQVTPEDAAALAEALRAARQAGAAQHTLAAALKTAVPPQDDPASPLATRGTLQHGFIETVMAKQVAGWINLDSIPAEAVELWHNGALAATCAGFGERPDLASAGLRVLRCGFSFRLAPGARLREGDRIEVRRPGALRATLALEVSPALVADSLRWHVDAVDEQVARGWAAWGFEPDLRVELRLEADGVDLGGTLADHYREDLNRAGIHDGYHGFELALWNLPAVAAAHEVRLVEARRGIELWRGQAGAALAARAIAASVAQGVVTAFVAPAFAREAWRSVAALPAACHAPLPTSNPTLDSSAFIEHLFARYWQKPRLDTADGILGGLLRACAALGGQVGGEIQLPPALLERANAPVTLAEAAGRPATRLLWLYGQGQQPEADWAADYPALLYRFVVDVGLRWKLDRRLITPALWAVLMEDAGPLDGMGPRLPRLWHLLHAEEPKLAAPLERLDPKDRARLLALFGSLLFAPAGGLDALPGPLAAACRAALDEAEAQGQWADLCRLAHWPPHRHAWDAALGRATPPPVLPRAEGGAGLPAVRVFSNEAAGTGLGQNVAYTLQALERIGARCRLIPCGHRREHLLALEETGQGAWVNLFHIQPDNLPLVIAGLPEPILAGSRNIGFFMWELPQLADAHRLGVELVDEVWTATRFTQALFAGATAKPVHRVGHAVAPVAPSARDFRAELGLQGKFVFLFAFDAHSCLGRKNPAGTLAAFRQAFGADPQGVHLVIKTSNLAKLRGQPQREAFMDALARCRGVTLLDARLSAPDLSALMREADAYVSLHRAEGFGYTAAEAMYFGRPVIATAYSGSEDFCTPDTAALVAGPLKALRHDDFIYEVPGAVWAEPDIGEAAAAMRRLAGDPGYARALAEAGQALIRESFSVARLAERYRERLVALAGSQ